MKKFLAIVLAVICIFSMATVAFAATNVPLRKCDACGTTFTTDLEFRNHVEKVCDRVCPLCKNVLETNEEKAAHEYNCRYNSIVCDYCGGTEVSQSDFDAHVEECKAKYFNIPLAKIIATVKDILSKIDFEQVIGTVKSLAEKVAPAIQDLIGKIGK